MNEQQETLVPTEDKNVEANEILNAAAAALRAKPGFGAAIVPGRKTQSLQVIAPSGAQYTFKLK